MQIVCGNWGIGLWARPEAKRRQAYLDKRRRGKYFDVLMQQADEARTRVREGTKWQVVPHQVARRAAGFKLSCGFEPKAVAETRKGKPRESPRGCTP